MATTDSSSTKITVDDDRSETQDSNSVGSDLGNEAASAFQHLAAISKVSEDDDENDDPSSKKASKNKHGGGGVQFGSVRVHTHKLTLGDNPGGKEAGPPVEFEWGHQESLRYGNIDEFALHEHGVRDSRVIHDKAQRLEAAERQRIAARDHSAGSIRKIQMQIHEIRSHRAKSKEEDLAEAEKQDALLNAKKRKAAQQKKQGFGAFFKRVFHHHD